MKVKFSQRLFTITCGFILSAPVLVAQACPSGVVAGASSCIKLFGAVDGAPSLTNVNSSPDGFNTTTLNLTCPASPVATLYGPALSNPTTLASPLQAGGNLLVDNDIIVTVTPTGGQSAAQPPVNVCPVTDFVEKTTGIYYQDCFTSGYQSNAGNLINQNPDTFLLTIPAGEGTVTETADLAGGVPPISIVSPITATILDPLNPPPPSAPSSPVGIVAGPQSVTIALTDTGGSFTSSSIFLATNCVQGPVTGPAQVTGNTISTGNAPSLTQTFSFNTATGGNVGLVYDLSGVTNYSANSSGSTPQTADLPVDPAAFQPYYVQGTSFATSTCLVHSGEGLPVSTAYPLVNGQPEPACKLYTLECTNGSGAGATGAQCPASESANEVIADVFDGPPFSLQNIYTPYGMFREGMGLLMASEGWGGGAVPPTQPTGGGPCQFDPNSGLGKLPCPQNLLTSFSGPGGFGGQGLTTNPNSTLITVYGVPEDFTSVFAAGEWPDHWINSSTQKVYFSSQPPNLSKGAYVLNNGKLVALTTAANFIPSPVKSITYGVSSITNPASPASNVPLPVNEPISTDSTLFNPTTVNPLTGECQAPAPGTTGPNVQPNFTPSAPVTLSLGEGQYLLHYYAQDCAGTQELQFTLNPPPPPPTNPPAPPSWVTSFYTYPIKVDLTKPTVTFHTPANTTALTQGGVYKVGQSVTAYYTCADPYTTPTPSSGVVLCGLNVYAPETTYSVNLTSKVPTGSVGPQTFTVYALDGAGNTSSASVNYCVGSCTNPK